MNGRLLLANPNQARVKRLARFSLVCGVTSIPLFFLIIPAGVAFILGYKAVRGLAATPALSRESIEARVGMALGLVSIFGGIAGAVIAPTTTMDKAWRTTALTTVVALESAVINFHTEYGSMPAEEERITTDSVAGVNFLRVLSGWEKRSPELRNPRDIKFLSLRAGKDRKNGLILDSQGISEGLFDPYGNGYVVFLKREGDEKLRFQFAGRSIELEGRLAAVVSPGKDGKLGTSDDIKSW